MEDGRWKVAEGFGNRHETILRTALSALMIFADRIHLVGYMGQNVPTMEPDAQREAALLEAGAKVSGKERAMFHLGPQDRNAALFAGRRSGD